GQRLWDEHVRAFEQAIRHRKSPREALLAGQTVVQQELDKVFQRERDPLLPAGVPIALFLGALVIAVGAFLVTAARSGRVGRLMRGEAAAGLLFASPWILGFLLFTLGPILASLLFSLCDYDVLHAPRYVGLRNYAQLVGLRSVQLHWLEGVREIRSGWEAL